MAEEIVRRGSLSIYLNCGGIRTTMLHCNCNSESSDCDTEQKPTVAKRGDRIKRNRRERSGLVNTTVNGTEPGRHAYYELTGDDKILCSPRMPDLDREPITRKIGLGTGYITVHHMPENLHPMILPLNIIS